jgi:hypothetical protein
MEKYVIKPISNGWAVMLPNRRNPPCLFFDTLSDAETFRDFINKNNYTIPR